MVEGRAKETTTAAGTGASNGAGTCQRNCRPQRFLSAPIVCGSGQQWPWQSSSGRYSCGASPAVAGTVTVTVRSSSNRHRSPDVQVPSKRTDQTQALSADPWNHKVLPRLTRARSRLRRPCKAHASLQVDFRVLSGAHASLQVDFKVLSGAHASLQVDFKVRSGLS